MVIDKKVLLLGDDGVFLSMSLFVLYAFVWFVFSV